MPVKNENQSVLTRELKIIPTWAWALAGVVFIAAQIFFNVHLAHHMHAPPAWARPLMGLAAGIAGAAYLLLLGYVNRDSKRRGMSPLLWTLVALLIPNALGFLVYFILRQPVQSACPQCGSAIQPGFNFCPRCSYKLSPTCPQCKHVVGRDDVFCPYCGTSLRTAAGTGTPPPGV